MSAAYSFKVVYFWREVLLQLIVMLLWVKKKEDEIKTKRQRTLEELDTVSCVVSLVVPQAATHFAASVALHTPHHTPQVHLYLKIWLIKSESSFFSRENWTSRKDLGPFSTSDRTKNETVSTPYDPVILQSSDRPNDSVDNFSLTSHDWVRVSPLVRGLSKWIGVNSFC